jgi:hypothetical protein
VSVWTDPDTTDDGSPGGKFWVTLEPADRGAVIGPDTRAQVSIRPLDRPGATETAPTTLVRDDPTQQYVAFVMDHEGPYAVHVALDGALGRAELEAEVQATYDLRPARWLLGVYLVPFLLVGLLWAKLLVRRRAHARASR